MIDEFNSKVANLENEKYSCECDCYTRFIPLPSDPPADDGIATKFNDRVKYSLEACLGDCEKTYGGKYYALLEKLNGQDKSPKCPGVAPPPSKPPVSAPASSNACAAKK